MSENRKFYDYNGKKVAIYVLEYTNDRLAIRMVDALSEEPLNMVTVNLEEPVEQDVSFIDINNLGGDILKWLNDNGFGTLTGRVARSGYCIYPEYRFDRGKLMEADPNGYSYYMGLFEKTPYEVECPYCKEKYMITMTAGQRLNLEYGDSHIQNIFPELLPEERELLRGGMCGKCWKKCFGDSE